MTSQKNFRKAVKIQGAKHRNNVLYVSSGITSLDYLSGGGLPAGCIFLVEQDVLGSYSRVMNKYFLAEGVACKHALFVASCEEDPHVILNELPVPTELDESENGSGRGDDKMSIAWRYESLGPVESSFGGNTNFGRNFDLSRHVDESSVKQCSVSIWSKNKTDLRFEGFHNALYGDLLNAINQNVKKEEFKPTNEKQNILRVCLMGLGSPFWTSHEINEDSHQEEGRDFIKFTYLLRLILRNTNAIALLSVPSFLFQSESTIKRARHSAHISIKLESFAGSDRETHPSFKDYHGLFHITKLSAYHTLVPHVPPSNDLAFKLRRKKFLIEKLHLPPELQESKEREQDDIVATAPSCGTYNKKIIDF